MNNRMFYVLCIEDEEEIRSFISDELLGCSKRISIKFAKSRDEAIQILESDAFFDFITLDLTIPISNDDFEKKPENGLSILGEAKTLRPGTPVLILTGTSTVRMISNFLETSNNVDIWAEGKTRPTVSHLPKIDISDFSEKISSCISSVLSLSDIEINYSYGHLPITYDRLIRIFGKKQGASYIEIMPIGGGYSDAKVYSLLLKDESGVELHRCIAKCGRRIDIEVDSSNFDTHVAKLKPEATPRKIDHIMFGATSDSAVFYGLAKEHSHSFFKASHDRLISDEILQSLKNILSNWHVNSKGERRQIKDIRRCVLTDEKMLELTSLYDIPDSHGFEDELINCNVSLTHGDLHGENILVDTDNNLTTLIDYGDITQQCAIFDPLTLECSFLFHNQSLFKNWPALEDLNSWDNLEEYIKDCPYPDEIKFFREWINDIGVGKRELAACLYSYALRQLKYDDTDKEKAKALINVSFNLLNQS